ncbi:MAG: RnfABCDGE type electron transport complex subunit B [Gammaproteobacteria bacterium]|nr:RnfABCDGE type electron transport complex subunit B [Gammaproteobacteria bacterium]
MSKPKKFSEVACIEESACIGCAKCYEACPVNAIIGAFQAMHTVIKDACIGCQLCLPPCPVDCIQMVPYSTFENPHKKAQQARERASFRRQRMRDQAEEEEQARLKAGRTSKKEVIREVLERAKASLELT